MIIYRVSTRAIFGEYIELVKVFNKMEEKPNSYIGHKKRIDKKKIGKIHEGSLRGSYYIDVLDEKEIPQAREQLKETIYPFIKKELENAQKQMDAYLKHDLDSEIELLEYE